MCNICLTIAHLGTMQGLLLVTMNYVLTEWQSKVMYKLLKTSACFHQNNAKDSSGVLPLYYYTRQIDSMLVLYLASASVALEFGFL